MTGASSIPIHKIIARREIKLTLDFVIPEDLYEEKNNRYYIDSINEWVKTWIMGPLNAKYPSTDLDPILSYIKAEDITS